MDDLKEMLIRTYDATVKEYAKHEFDNKVMERHYKKFTSLIPKCAKILDIGCGPGQAAKRFSDKGYDVTGIDLSKNMIEFAKKKVKNAKFFVMDMEKMDFSEKFDAIWAAFVLIHIKREKHQEVIRNLCNLLKPNGILFLGMLEGDGEKTTQEPYNRKYKQYFVFTPRKEIENYLRNAGFELLEYTTEEFNEEGDVFTLSFTYAKNNR